MAEFTLFISTLYFVGVNVHDSGVCAGKDCILVVGGRQRGQGACKFDLETHEWVDLPDMNTGRRCPGKRLIHLRHFNFPLPHLRNLQD